VIKRESITDALFCLHFRQENSRKLLFLLTIQLRKGALPQECRKGNAAQEQQTAGEDAQGTRRERQYLGKCQEKPGRKWCGWLGSNQRPLASEANSLTGCQPLSMRVCGFQTTPESNLRAMRAPAYRRRLWRSRMAGIWQYRGKWKCQVRKEGFPSQSKTFETKAQAVAWGIEVESKMNQGTFAGGTTKQSMTISEMLARYLAEESPNKAYAAADLSRSKPLIAAIGGVPRSQAHAYGPCQVQA
jgi:hypothetical protein